METLNKNQINLDKQSQEMTEKFEIATKKLDAYDEKFNTFKKGIYDMLMDWRNNGGDPK
jgi:hypothetical protein